MIKFDSTSIYNRILSKLQQDPNWKVVVNNSVISSLIKSNAEINAEIARYAEYMFKESRWDTAQNNSSILSMANMMGYQPKRKISARGKVYVSLDPRTHLVGKTISFDAFEDLLDSKTCSVTSDWYVNNYSPININSACTITDSKGNSYIITKESQLAQGKYITSIDVMQGTMKSVFIDIATIRNTATFSKMDPYLYIPVRISDCEDASNLSSIPFLKVYIAKPVQDSEGNESLTYEEYRVVDNLLLSNLSDRDCEFYNDLYNQDLFYLKFNNDLYNGITLDLSQNSSIVGIRIDYVESTGASGNIEDLFENFTVIDVKTQNDVSVKLYGVNYTAINGGSDNESINNIKKNTIKTYTKYFSIGTKEAYKKAIANTEFKITGIDEVIKPKKVQVFGDTSVSPPITYVSFIGSGLEDLATIYTDDNPYDKVDDALGYYLTRLKSPQDKIKFIPPKYTAFSVGLDCTVSNDSEYELIPLQSGISDYVDSQWGPNSDVIDFGNNFISSKLVKDIMYTYSDITSIDLTLEAVTKLNWSDATIITPSEYEGNGILHTCRLPFDYSSVFLGDQSVSGFKDYTVGAEYIMRIDIMYKKPTTLNNTKSLHKSIFVEEDKTRSFSDDGSMDDSYKRGFYSIQTTDDNIWTATALTQDDYVMLKNVSELTTCYQIDYQQNVLNDNSYLTLKQNITNGKISTRTSDASRGAIDNYIVYFSGNYSKNSETIGEGWIEFTFDDIYAVLQTFSLYDSSISEALKKCPLYSLKCGQANTTVFTEFKTLVSKYVDIYVSMRPISQNLRLTTASEYTQYKVNESREVLYIDSYDTKSFDSDNNVTNLTIDKKSRFINVNCKYEEV